ncbi:hypothetical protein TREMEDRAFT_61897 [Tremella mesenterica DSM 1558]|uniref:uncharacterized protein n=1 Tax=Tremella mesenterica (strain ATCC 24925 / CBS 8224 / DSM 1558 / NBRC 9311 / NRRL Y-6157 / RJB 2259-6 / UBC 559-6) TaxID=578456 RepID=UPI0003F494B5|nr:uncharacterized protein TREMEDRAFT_61897 [Tremella mesenterica DSM 1558]EIW70137.1 hypothetical protein TREMEDRAFT_61897 [Tremella mesenterica DSM 1558]
MAPSTPTTNPFAAMRNFGGMMSSALSFGDRSRQVSSLGLGTLSLGEPSGAASPPRSASPPAASPAASPRAGSLSPESEPSVVETGPPGPPATSPRRRTPAFRPGESPSSSDLDVSGSSESGDQPDDEDNEDDEEDEDEDDLEGSVDREGETELEEYSEDDMEVDRVEDNDPLLSPPPAQLAGQKRRRSLSSSSSSSSSSSEVLPPPDAIAAAAAAAAARRAATVSRPAAADTRPVAAEPVAATLPSPRGEPSPKRVKRSLREEEYLWEKMKSEPGRWIAVGVDEACDRCRREIITYNRPNWPCLKAVRPHNKALRCASCTSGPCSFCPVSSARDIPPRPFDASPLPPPQTPASVPRSRVPSSSLRSVRRTSPSSRSSPPSPSPFVPVAGPSHLPAAPPSSSRRPSASRPSAPRPSSPVVASPPAHGTRSRRPSAPPATPAAAPVTESPASKKTPKSSLKKSKGKRKEKEVVFEAGDVEDETTQRAGPSVPRLSFVHPRISLDPRIPEDEKELATYRSLVLGLTTQLDVARRDTSLLLDFSTRQANALNNLYCGVSRCSQRWESERGSKDEVSGRLSPKPY